MLRRYIILPRANATFALLSLEYMTLTGCSAGSAPSFDLFGASFLAWLLCGLIGIAGEAGRPRSCQQLVLHRRREPEYHQKESATSAAAAAPTSRPEPVAQEADRRAGSVGCRAPSADLLEPFRQGRRECSRRTFQRLRARAAAAMQRVTPSI
jgi:hypothetical protein